MGEYQTEFIKGRSILNGIVITHKDIQVKKERKKGFLLNLDFEKIYDRVNWECLLEVLKVRKFGPKWTGWIEK